jgi:hypothetical protein
MKKVFPILMIIIGAVFVVAGGYTVKRGIDAKNEVKTELVAQRIVTPEDASIPNTPVEDVATARSMAAIIDHHALTAAKGKTYSEMGKYLAKDGTDTNDAANAVTGSDGKPVANPLRNTAFQASSLRTSLYSSVMAFEIATLVTGLGVLLFALGFAVGGTGVAFAGLALPKFARRVHVEPVAAAH